MPYKSREVLKVLQKLGFEIKRQKGSHILLVHPDGRRTYVAMHTKDLPKGTFYSILKQAEITIDEFRNIK
jgi:predicted RNA binding protein YcfA (HicA-like mRNA interferase family)